MRRVPSNAHRARFVLFSLVFLNSFLFPSGSALAQVTRRYDVARPAERSSNDRVVFRSVPQAPTKGALAVVLNYLVNASVVVKDARGRQVAKAEANDGQADFQLTRGKSYLIEVSHPSYLGASNKTKPLGATEIVRANLTPQFAALRLRGLPPNSQVFIDDELPQTADQSGNVAIENLKPGNHDLLVRHPQYNDYIEKLLGLKAGDDVTIPRLNLVRVTRIAIQGPPGASVFIDGDLQGRIKPDGQVLINFELDERTIERTISVELLGYQPWIQREVLTPSIRRYEITLDPIITSAGVTDFFDNLTLWAAPPTWKLVSEQRNKKLEVRSEALGVIKDRIYGDFDANFTVWLPDGKGASWAIRADKEGRNYYLFHLSGPDSTAFTPRRFHSFLISDGGKPVEVIPPGPVIPELNKKSSYNITISVRGNRIKHTITSNETGVTDDLSALTDEAAIKNKYLFGSFGFRALAGEVFTVDELSIEPVKP